MTNIPEKPEVVNPNGEKVYISGPMTGKENFNFPLFFAWEEQLASLGYEVINPARLDIEREEEDKTWEEFLKRDLAAILTEGVTMILLIDDWSNSRGATLEAYVGLQVGIPVFEAVNQGESFNIVPTERISAAYEAQSIVLGARRYTYGHPLENFQLIADLFNATIGHKLTEPLTIVDVALLMIQVKVAREQNQPKEDNRTDIIGYALALDEALREQKRRGI